MKFIKTVSGMVNVNHVMTIRRSSDNSASLQMSNGKYESAVDQYEQVVHDVAEIIPNLTSILAVKMKADDDGIHFSTEHIPVIGWRLGGDGPEAILPNGETAEFLLYPDGRVESEDGESFGSLQKAQRAFAATSKLKLRERGDLV